MKKDVKRQQKDILATYLDSLRNTDLLTATDFLEAIEQAKELKSMCFREIKKGNTDIMRFFTDYTKLIIDLWESMPKADIDNNDKTTIEDAFRVLNLTVNLDNIDNSTQQ